VAYERVKRTYLKVYKVWRHNQVVISVIRQTKLDRTSIIVLFDIKMHLLMFF